MRIVLVGTSFPLRGGIAHYVALLYKKLRARGHEVNVLSFKRQYPSILFPGKTQDDEGAELVPIQAFPILDSINPVTWLKAVFWIKKIKPDCLVFKYWMPFFAPCYATIVFLVKTMLNVRTLYICDNIAPHEKKIGDRILSRLGLRFVDSFIVQSRAVQDDLLKFRPDAVYRNIPHPVYEIFPPAVSKAMARDKLKISDEKVILYFGYIRAYKGLRYLIQALPMVLQKLPVRLLVCGEFYEGREETMRLVDTLDLTERVIVYDKFIPNEDVGLYFCAADLVVLPYTSATQSGIVQVAYHYDRPVVITDVGGLPEVVPHDRCGYVVPPKHPRAIADAILRFYREKKEKEFVKNVKKEKQKYSWDRMTEAIEELVNR